MSAQCCQRAGVAVCLTTVLFAAATAFAEKPEVILKPGVSWQIYDASGQAVSAVTVDDVIPALDVVAWRVDDSGGGVGPLQTGSAEQARAAIAAEFAKGVRVARGHFLDRGHLNFTPTKTYEMAEAVAEGTGGGAGGRTEAAPTPGRQPAEGGPPAGAQAKGAPGSAPGGAPVGPAGPGGPKSPTRAPSGPPGTGAAAGPGGPPAGEGGAPGEAPKPAGPGAPGEGPGAKPAPPGGAEGPGPGDAAGAAGADETEKKSLPILPIGIGALVVIGIVLLLISRKKKA